MYVDSIIYNQCVGSYLNVPDEIPLPIFYTKVFPDEILTIEFPEITVQGTLDIQSLYP
jgi:hypothetical protein